MEELQNQRPDIRQYGTGDMELISGLINQVLPRDISTIRNLLISEKVGNGIYAVIEAGGSLEKSAISLVCRLDILDQDREMVGRIIIVYKQIVGVGYEIIPLVVSDIKEIYRDKTKGELKALNENGGQKIATYRKILGEFNPLLEILECSSGGDNKPSLVVVDYCKLATGEVMMRNTSVQFDHSEVELVSKVPVEPPYKLF